MAIDDNIKNEDHDFEEQKFDEIDDSELERDQKEREEGDLEIKEVDICREMKNSFLSYAMSVIVSRALPDVRDGLKPVHRRILFGMSELSVFPDKPYKKSARIVGEVMGKFHPHGDTAIYDAMVRMAQDFNYRHTLVDGHGNFGSLDGDAPAAMRYTEARLSKIAMEMLRDLQKDTVNFIDNYDGTEKEPEVLPCRFPNLLVNGSTGIAVGMATNIPPHNLGEIVDGILALIDNPGIDVDGLMNYIKGPDFPTGGEIMGLAQIRRMYMQGEGTLVVRAKAEIHQLASGKSEIIVTEIPYQTNKERLIERIAECVKGKIIDGITDLQDHSGRQGTRIVIELRRDVNPNVVLNQLYKHTSLQTTFGANMIALVNNEPKTLTLKEMLEYYLKHQIEVITRRTQFDLDKAEARAHIVEGLLIALASIDEVVAVIKSSKDTETAKRGLVSTFRLTDIQAQAILDMRLSRLTSLEVDKLRDELAELKKFIKECRDILRSENKKLKVIVGELTELKERFANERKCEINLKELTEIADGDLIPVQETLITITNTGYIKRLTANTYTSQNRGGKGITGAKLVEDDYVQQVIFTSSHDNLFFFTNMGSVFKLKAFQIPVYSRTSRGTHINNHLNMQKGEKLNAVLPIPDDLEKDHYLVFITRKGIIKRTPLSEFQNIRTNGIRAVNLNEGDELFKVGLTDGDKDIILGASNGKAIRFSENDVPSMKRVAAGVRGLDLFENEQIVGMAIVTTDGDEIIIVTEFGIGKRTPVSSFRLQKRGGRGCKSLSITDRSGSMVALETVRGDEDLFIVSDKGMVIRTPLSQISTFGRDAKGAKLMELNEGQRVSHIAIVPSEEKINEFENLQLDSDYKFLDERDQEDSEEENHEQDEEDYNLL